MDIGQGERWVNNSTKTGLLVALLVTSTGAYAQPGKWSLGVGAAYSPEVYKDTSSSRTVIPIIGYEGEHVFFRGFSAGYRLFPRGSTHNVVARLQYDPRTLDPDESSDPNIRKLDKRRSTVLGGASYEYRSPIGVFELAAGTDIGSTHNGLYAQASYSYPFIGRGWGLVPNIGYAYNNEKLNRHLYGVSESEAARTDFDPFEPDWDGNFFIGMSGFFGITRRISIMGSVRYTNLEGDLEESPILDATVGTSVMLGITYSL
ncbi:MipA/OmpV family protein [Vibrio sp. WXL103]|uniref:MipA/OmpV family protein n=1 Tax=Vibrio sp. WXL103 TaxID=3450710 RepID=UPI003EC72881